MKSEKISKQYPSDPKLINESFEMVADFLSDLNLKEDDAYNLKLCFTEAFANAIEHGNEHNPDLMVDVEVTKGEDFYELAVRDHGKGFDYEEIADCTQEENLVKDGGRGVHLMRQLMDEVKFEDNGTCIRMIKRINP